MDGDNRACSIGGCTSVAGPNRLCRIDRLYLCEEHYEAHYSGTPCHELPEEEVNARRDKALSREFNKLLVALSAIDLATRGEQLRPGHSCKVPPPTPKESLSYDDMKAGAFHVHFEVDFEDGVKWLARIRQNGFECPRLGMSRLMTRSEVATQRIMNAAGLPVPNAWFPKAAATDLDLCYVEYVQGKPYSRPGDEKNPITWTMIEDYARYGIKLSELKFFGRVGSLADDTGTVGPFISRDFYTSTPPYFYGPFKSVAERFSWHVELHLKDIASGKVNSAAPVEAYLTQLGIRDLVMQDPELCEEVTEGYIKHGDEGGDHIMMDDEGHIRGIIDWDWAMITSKNEAFAAPEGFVSDEMFWGNDSNKLGPIEAALAEAYDRLGRPDLGDCVRNGKKYQRLKQLVGRGTVPWGGLCAAIEAMTGSLPKEAGIEEWLENVEGRHGDNAGLKHLKSQAAVSAAAATDGTK